YPLPTPGHVGGETRIIKGYECTPHSQPWQVALFQKTRLLCGATLIAPKWLLTAAHCRKPWVRVHLGRHSGHRGRGGQEMAVAESIPHPRYNGSREDHNHDVMLIRLRRQASLGPKVKPIKLADHCPQAGQQCTISGWGTVTSPRENFPDTLNCAEVKIFPQKQCEDAYPGKITDGMICAGDSSGADTCQGDSGGPVVCNGMLQGLVSWGDFPCGKPSKPGVYTNLCQFTKWIHGTIKS
uniref:Kallikrein-8-like n=1 Tax=Loxodonta africana TaxID=9785 RepID=G3U8X6_LOXAF